jgi:transcription elongation factor GreB
MYKRFVSKAFTSEETPDLEPVVRVPPRLAPGEVRYVTPEGLAALRGELAALPPGDPRAARLERTLASLTVLGPESAPEGKVGFGCWATVEDEAGARRTWRIVGPDEADPRRGLVSVHAPVAAALLGKEAGDVVEVERPGGTAEYEIVAVHRAAPAL